jgi:alcohol dehydrogenase class IV
MSYSVAGLVHDYRCPGYPPDEPLVPHGISVVVNAPSVFRLTAATSPDRHLAAARALGADARGADRADAAAVLSETLLAMMRATNVPCGLAHIGYRPDDLDALSSGAIVQRRLVDNAPLPVSQALLRDLFREAIDYG